MPLRLCQNGDVNLKKDFIKKPFMLSVALFSAIAVMSRFFQLAFNIESETGFYKNPWDAANIIFVIILAAAFVFGFIWYYLMKKTNSLPPDCKFDFSPLFSERILLAAVAIGFAVNTFYEIFRIKNPFPDVMQTQSVAAFAVITTITSALCLVYFIALSFIIENMPAATSYLCVVTVAWIAFRVLRDFISFTTLFFISENLLDIVYLCLLMLCMFSVCRLFADADTKKGYTLFTLFAPLTIVLGFTLSIPAILGFLCGFESVGESDMFMHFVDLMLSLFLLRVGSYIYREN